MNKGFTPMVQVFQNIPKKSRNDTLPVAHKKWHDYMLEDYNFFWDIHICTNNQPLYIK